MTDFRPIEFEELESRIKECEEKVRQGEMAALEIRKLETYRNLVFELRGVSPKAEKATEVPTVPPPSPRAELSRARPPERPTGDLARDILREANKPLKIREIMHLMLERGWGTSGDDKKDFDRVYAAIHRKPEVFENVGQGTWRLKNVDGQ